MPEAPYQNREIREMFEAADQRADEFHEKLMDRMDVFEEGTSKSLSRIEVQTTTTNGRVKDLELSRARQDGFYKALAIFSVAGWALLGWLVTKTLETNSMLLNIDTRLSAFESVK